MVKVEEREGEGVGEGEDDGGGDDGGGVPDSVNDQILLQSLQVPGESLAFTRQYHKPSVKEGV